MSPNNKTRIAKLSFVVLLCSFSSSFLCPTFLHTTGTRTLHEREDSVLVPVVWEVGSEAYIIAPQQLPRNNRQKSCGELLFMGSCVWGAIILFLRQNFETIVSGMVFVILIFYIATTLAFFKFRRFRIGEDGYQIPFYPYLPLLFLVVLVSLVSLRVYYQFELSIQDLSFVLSGVPIYFLFFKHKVND